MFGNWKFGSKLQLWELIGCLSLKLFGLTYLSLYTDKSAFETI